MKVIIAGSRTVKYDVGYDMVKGVIEESGFEIEEVVSGCNGGVSREEDGTKYEQGVDYFGEKWAKENDIPIKKFHPDWNTHGKSAGPIRNRKMAEYADALVLVWDGSSRGSASMLREANNKGLKIFAVDFTNY